MNKFIIEDPAGGTKSVPGPPLEPGNPAASSQSRSNPQLSSASSYADLHYLFSAQNVKMIAPKTNRNRRRSPQGQQDHTKHRRTRSGCYTCRIRRVKCDEVRPVCDRCKKGGRECIYPETPTASKAPGSGASKSKSSTARGRSGSSSEDGEENSPNNLEAIPHEDEMLADLPRPPELSRTGTQRSNISQATVGSKSVMRTGSETPSLIQDKGLSPTPSTESSVEFSIHQGRRKEGKSSISSASGSSLRSDWSHLPPDLQFYLAYFYENLTHLHYSLKMDSGNFLRTRFLDAALRNEALLYALIGFSAFHRTLHSPEGNIQDFLPYYNKAVCLLLESLGKGERRDNGTILAILQLATIEEFLGDWINLSNHQKAACNIITGLYTPQTIMEDEMTRVILGWYIRFDVFAGLMGGFATALSREWFSYAVDFFERKVVEDPQNLDWKIEHSIAQQRLIAIDMSFLFAKNGKGEISRNDFTRKNIDIGRRIKEWKTKIDPALQDPRFLVTDFSGARPLDPDDIVDPYQPGLIFHGPLWVMNVATIDWFSIDLMHEYQTALTMRTQPSKDLAMKAYASCQLFEAMEFFPGSLPGTVLACQASLGIACLFLPRDSTHAMWARRKLATIESNGYIYPYTFRTKMADIFRDRSCMHWWLPNDEAYPPIIRSIREFVEERSAIAKKIPAQEDLRDMKAIFAAMKLDDGKSSLPPSVITRRSSAADVTLASQEEYLAKSEAQLLNSIGEGDPYGLGFDEGIGFWGNYQGGGAYGVPKP